MNDSIIEIAKLIAYGSLGYLCKALIDHILKGRSEKQKAVHAERLTISKQIMSELNTLQDYLRKSIRGINPNANDLATAQTQFELFAKMVKDHKYLFSKKTQETLSEIVDKIRRCFLDASMADAFYVGQTMPPETKELRLAVSSFIDTRLPELKQSLEEQFGKTLGVI